MALAVVSAAQDQEPLGVVPCLPALCVVDFQEGHALAAGDASGRGRGEWWQEEEKEGARAGEVAGDPGRRIGRLETRAAGALETVAFLDTN